MASALQVSGLRERGEWESVLATARTGRALVADLLRGSLLACVVPLLLASLLFGAGEWADLALGRPAQPLLLPGAALLACLGTGALAVGLGQLAGLVARTQAAALGLSLLLLVGSLAWGLLGAALLEQTVLGQGLDFASRLSATALAAAVVVPLQVWLLECSRGRPTLGRLSFDLALGAGLLCPSLLHGVLVARSALEALLFVALVSTALGAPLLVVVLRRPSWWLGRTG
jgi:hypothetical protein